MRSMPWSYHFTSLPEHRRASRVERGNDQPASLSCRPMRVATKQALKGRSMSVPARLRGHHTSSPTPGTARPLLDLGTGRSASPCHSPGQPTPERLWYLSFLIPLTFEHGYNHPPKNKVRACEAALRCTHFSSRTLKKRRGSFGVLNLKDQDGFVVFLVLWGLTIQKVRQNFRVFRSWA